MTQPLPERTPERLDADYYFRLEALFEPPPVRPALTEWQQAEAGRAASS